MDNLNWNLALATMENNTVLQPGPETSGVYLCTCFVTTIQGNKKYLKMMEYNAEKKYWHDEGKPHAIGSNVLAWAEINMCDFNDFDNIAGYPVKARY